MNYFAILTDTGIAKIAAGVFAPAIMQFGDTNRVPVSTDTSLAHKVCEANLINVIAENNKVIMEAIAPELTMGFWIREVGVLDTDGDLVAIARYPETFKPADTDGSAKEVCVRMVLQISNASEIVVQFNHGAIEWVNRNLSNLSAIGEGVLTTIVENALATKAPLESPTFSGIPTAPTPTTETNTNQIATTEFVRVAIAALVNGSPVALDTLKELADALGGDENFATTITNLLALKANRTDDTIVVASVNPTAAFNVRNIKAQNTDPGVGSELTDGNILLIYED